MANSTNAPTARDHLQTADNAFQALAMAAAAAQVERAKLADEIAELTARRDEARRECEAAAQKLREQEQLSHLEFLQRCHDAGITRSSFDEIRKLLEDAKQNQGSVNAQS